MIDLSIITISVFTAIIVSVLSYIFIRSRFIQQQSSLEEQLKCKMAIIEGMERTVRITQSEKEQFLTRAIKAETQLVMVKVAMAETRELDSEILEDVMVEDVELARQILEIDSKIILAKM